MRLTKLTIVVLIVVAYWVTGCSRTGATASEDVSVSGMVAGVIGGANSRSAANGALSWLAPAVKRDFSLASLGSWLDPVATAWANITCPTTMTSYSPDCTQTSSTSVTLLFNSCTPRESGATLSGTELVSVTGGVLTCGTTPTGLTSIARTFADLRGDTESFLTRVSGGGTKVKIDSSGALDPSYAAESGGITVTYGAAKTIEIRGINVVSSNFSHTIFTTTPVQVTSTDTTATGNVIGGSVTVLHNVLGIAGKATFNGITYTAGCCLPTSGSITTSFGTIGGVTPSTKGEAFLAAGSETLTFTSCGIGTYTGPENEVGYVTIDQCI